MEGRVSRAATGPGRVQQRPEPFGTQRVNHAPSRPREDSRGGSYYGAGGKQPEEMTAKKRNKPGAMEPQPKTNKNELPQRSAKNAKEGCGFPLSCYPRRAPFGSLIFERIFCGLIAERMGNIDDPSNLRVTHFFRGTLTTDLSGRSLFSLFPPVKSFVWLRLCRAASGNFLWTGRGFPRILLPG